MTRILKITVRDTITENKLSWVEKEVVANLPKMGEIKNWSWSDNGAGLMFLYFELPLMTVKNRKMLKRSLRQKNIKAIWTI